MLKVFVSTNFEQRALVRTLHATLIGIGVLPVSSWANIPGSGGEPRRSLAEERAQADQNDRDLVSAHLVLVIGTARGGEHLCEARWAITQGIPVLWTGRTCLSAYREGVRIVRGENESPEEDLKIAVAHIRRLSDLVSQPWDPVDEWKRDRILSDFSLAEYEAKRRAIGLPPEFVVEPPPEAVSA
jgi:hypothetical protein